MRPPTLQVGAAVTAAVAGLEPCRVAELLKVAESSVRALGMTPLRISTRLILALITEAALIELAAGQKVPAARKVIRSLLTVNG